MSAFGSAPSMIGHAATFGHAPLMSSGAFRGANGAMHAPFTGSFQAPFQQGHSFGSFHHHFSCHHHHQLFAFFFAPLVALGYAYPAWYDYPYVEPDEDQTDVEEFEPYYSDWAWSAPDRAYLAQYFITPEAWLLVIRYAEQPTLAYYYDPIAGQFVGMLDLTSGEYLRWYVNTGWSDPVTFPFDLPPPI